MTLTAHPGTDTKIYFQCAVVVVSLGMSTSRACGGHQMFLFFRCWRHSGSVFAPSANIYIIMCLADNAHFCIIYVLVSRGQNTMTHTSRYHKHIRTHTHTRAHQLVGVGGTHDSHQRPTDQSTHARARMQASMRENQTELDKKYNAVFICNTLEQTHTHTNAKSQPQTISI